MTYIRLDGTPGTFITTTAPAALTGAMTMRAEVDVSLDIWQDNGPDNGGQCLISHEGASGNRSFRCLGSTAGVPFRLYMDASFSGTTSVPSFVLSAASLYADGSRRWVRYDFTSETGGSQSRCIFETSDNGQDWTLVQSIVSAQELPTGLRGSTARLALGAQDSAAAGFVKAVGNFYRARVYVNGELVASPDFTALTPDRTSVTDEQGNVWTWGGAAHVAGTFDPVVNVGCEAVEPVPRATGPAGRGSWAECAPEIPGAGGGRR